MAVKGATAKTVVIEKLKYSSDLHDFHYNNILLRFCKSNIFK